MRHLKILIADDDADHRDLLARAVRKGNPLVRLDTVGTREEFVQKAREIDYDCIVLDYNIPPTTAPELVRTLREEGADVPILVVSSSEEQRVVVESLRLGAADYVPKAVALTSLWERVQAVVASSRAQRCDRRVAERRVRRLARAAFTDPLTGLSNRWSLQRQLGDLRRECGRRGQIALVMLDLDHFKRINDAFGHRAGDRVLRAAAEILQTRDDGLNSLARWGGEEFLLVHPAASQADAWMWSDRIRRDFERARVPAAGQTIGFTASFGLAMWGMGADLEHNLCIADRTLYLAKELGRNRVCTQPMLDAMEIARQVAALPDTTPRRRLESLRARLEPSLGEVQREHICPHAASVARLAAQLAAETGLSREEQDTIALAAEFHDLGKLAIPEALLAAPRSLQAEERLFINEHARFGADLVAAAGGGERVARLVAAHHDRYDARTSVDRAMPPDDHDAAMILNMADSIVTMLGHRPYSPPLSQSDALIELRRQCGKQFDPRLLRRVECFLHGPALAV